MERQQDAIEEYSLTEPLSSQRTSSVDLDRDGSIPHSSLGSSRHLASVVEKKRLWWRNALVNALFIAGWFGFATLLSVYNKWMFSPAYYGFPAPLFVTTMHMVVQFGFAALFRYAWPHLFRPAHDPTPKEYSTKAVPTAVATSLDIGLSNLSLKTITLSFYTMCKSSSLVFVLLFAFLFRLEHFSWRLVGVIFLIFAGVLLMVATQTHFVFGGFMLVISASAMGGLRWSLTQILLKNKKMGMDNPASTIFWLAPAMGVSLAIVSLAIEGWPTLFQTKFFQDASHIASTVFYLSFPGAIAFFMVLSEFYIIQRTGVVPMSIAGIAKEVSTITISAWFFGDELTPLNITGVGVTVAGIVLFTYHKYRKSIDSPIPLDAHGNPISDADEVLADLDAEDSERAHLTAHHYHTDEPDEVRINALVTLLRPLNASLPNRTMVNQSDKCIQSRSEMSGRERPGRLRLRPATNKDKGPLWMAITPGRQDESRMGTSRAVGAANWDGVGGYKSGLHAPR
ncbi:triose-phosphate transporter family-domain-containing protein [Ephemerocybe angulata]|uniref:Triose-phosphate transporter family-domain-containing protein n=1 Tax=Ephemerocybe angulata TaxID=980116 RepID=A0A8H6MDJ5_9AGAR|nr:triose-phosphate transporter family-domain-containing protein [Tulosesus angulatus]